jgi:hypothetical protein
MGHCRWVSLALLCAVASQVQRQPTADIFIFLLARFRRQTSKQNSTLPLVAQYYYYLHFYYGYSLSNL